MWMFYNVTMGIKDRSVFTPPKFCSQKVIFFYFVKVCDFFCRDSVVMYTFMLHDLRNVHGFDRATSKGMQEVGICFNNLFIFSANSYKTFVE